MPGLTLMGQPNVTSAAAFAECAKAGAGCPCLACGIARAFAPVLAQARRQKALRQGPLSGHQNCDGTGTISVPHFLTVDDTVDALAWEAVPARALGDYLPLSMSAGVIDEICRRLPEVVRLCRLTRERGMTWLGERIGADTTGRYCSFVFCAEHWPAIEALLPLREAG